MTGIPLLSLTIFLPLIGALFILFVRGDEQTVARNARYVALWTSVVTFVVSLFLWFGFKPGTAEFQFLEEHQWFPEFNIAYRVGIDGISLFFVLLSTLLTPICVLASWESIKSRVKEYMIAFLVLETFMVGMFCALDFFAFYVFFEGVLIPMFLIIGVWGGGNRIYAAFKFFLYTFLGSVLMLIAILAMYWDVGSASIPAALQHTFSPAMQPWLWIAFFASFAVKMPMWPVHTWLPDAHVEAPTAGSVILAGVLLKMGGYGFLRFSIPMFPLASADFAPLVYGLSCVAVIYTSLVALAQEDMKKLIAYSSVAHMAIVTVGLFAFNQAGIEGAMMVMLGHGLVSGALFLCVGVIYDRLHTREIDRYGGLSINMPQYAILFMLFTMASVGLPGTSNFVGEFLSLMGVYEASSWVAIICTTGIILGAAYMLYLYRRICYGEQKNADAAAMPDLTMREIVMLVPIALGVLWMGIYPESFLAPMRADVQAVVARLAPAKPEGDAHLAMGTAKPVAEEHHATDHETAAGEAH